LAVKIFLVRHGQTLWNLESRYQGITNTPLTEEGKKQASCAAKYLSKVEFDSFYSSPIGRTVETAEIFKKILKKDYVIKDDLKEMSFGAWEGLVFSDIISKHSTDFQNWIKDPFNNPPTKGETFSEIIERGRKGIEEIIEENNNEGNVLVVTHGGFIVAMLVYWLKMAADRWSSIIQSHGAINVVVMDKDHPFISTINFTGHLDKYYSGSSDKVIKNYVSLRNKKL